VKILRFKSVYGMEKGHKASRDQDRGNSSLKTKSQKSDVSVFPEQIESD
jgi:hypothetical protein